MFEFWLKIFSVAFGLGVVSGTGWRSVRHEWDVWREGRDQFKGCCFRMKPSQPFSRSQFFPDFLFFSDVSRSAAVSPVFDGDGGAGDHALGFWIMVNNSWMQAPVGYAIENGEYVAADWPKILFGPVLWVRFPHMLLASYITGAFCVAATGAWYLLREKFHAEARIMLSMGLLLGAVLVPVQLFFGHLTGDYVHDYQPAKFAAIEGRWHDQQPASEVLIAVPDPHPKPTAMRSAFRSSAALSEA